MNAAACILTKIKKVENISQKSFFWLFLKNRFLLVYESLNGVAPQHTHPELSGLLDINCSAEPEPETNMKKQLNFLMLH